jgi:hypothetical protein
MVKTSYNISLEPNGTKFIFVFICVTVCGSNYEQKVLTMMMIPSTAITSLLNSLNIKNTTTYNIGNLDPSLLQAQKCGMVKLVK